MKTLSRVIFLLIINLAYNYSYSQSYTIDDLKIALDSYDLKQAEIILESSIDIKNKQNEFLFEKSRFAYFTTNDVVNYYISLLEIKSLNDITDTLLFRVNDELIYSYNKDLENAISPNLLIDENCALASLNKNPKQLITCNYYQLSDLIQNSKYDRAKMLIKASIQLSKENNFKSSTNKLLENLAIIHQQAKEYDSSMVVYQKIREVLETNKDSSQLKDLYFNIGRLYEKQMDYEKSISFIQKSIIYSNQKDVDNNIPFKIKYLANAYYLNKDFKLSADSYLSYHNITDSIHQIENRRAMEELEIKYQTAKKEKLIAKAEIKEEQNKITIYTLSGGAIILFLSGTFFYNNQRKKKLLAQKEQELEKQRADGILKNQELATIDAMISGQEKERKQLAEELHDNLGSSLTTVKLYFENLKSNVKDAQGLEVYNRTEQILDNTYETIRSMSHTRNNGVLASKGLIPSIVSLSNKITASGKLHVEVIHHGLDKKLESSTELIIFRTIQELLSNVVKHAQATSAVVNLTSYENILNIMVEDNGKGFDATTLPENDGMGLHSIEKRIESFEGSFEIDSHLGRGTTINIDIPYYDQPNYS